MGGCQTKKGDKGGTSLREGVRVNKNDNLIHLIGEIDELNCHLGILTYNLSLLYTDSDLIKYLQCLLFQLGAQLASSNDDYFWLSEDTLYLEQVIDKHTDKLPELTSFILPGGLNNVSNQYHLCRAIARRVERTAVDCNVNRYVLQFLNRLSDLFFTMARYDNHIKEYKEIEWKSDWRKNF